MNVKRITPILNVSNLSDSFAWFEKLGWTKDWEFGDPADFGSVRSGDCEVFLSVDGHGSRGRGASARTAGPDGDRIGDKGVWMSLWVDDVDAVHRRCVEQDLDVTWPPADMPWSVREMHVRHPDGHVLRFSEPLD